MTKKVMLGADIEKMLQDASDARRSGLTDLLPCPFCGGEAKTKDVEYEPCSWQVVCKDYNCIAGWHSKHDETEADAIKRWNKRAR